MDIYKNRIFHQWSKSEDLKDETLRKTIDEMNKGLYDANLGSGLSKKRVAMPGKGKRGSYRTLIAFMENEKAFFIYGFSKNKKSEISNAEKEAYRKLAKDFLSMRHEEIQHLLTMNRLFEVN
jgi:hypothetical protein